MKKWLTVFAIFALVIGCGTSPKTKTDPRETNSPFGALVFFGWNHKWNNFWYPDMAAVEKAADLAKDAGIGIVRMDFIVDDIEPAPGKFDFKKFDMIVDVLSKRNIKVLGVMSYNAKWTGKEWNDAPDPEVYLKFAVRTVKHFKDRVKYWEIWNEPDNKFYWKPQDDMKSYVALLKRVYPALKKADPTCVILMGGIEKKIPVSLKHIYQQGGKGYFDVANMHPFRDPNDPNALEILRGTFTSLRKIMEENGDGNKEVWITEIGCPGLTPELKAEKMRKLKVDTYGWWLGEPPSEKLQAKWVEKVYKNAVKWPGLSKVFWAFYQDWPDFFKSAENEMGLVRSDYSLKPAYESYKKIAQDYYSANQNQQ